MSNRPRKVCGREQATTFFFKEGLLFYRAMGILCIGLSPTDACNRPKTLLIRIVRLTFRPEALDAFLTIFDASAPHIRAFPGCTHLALWQDEATPHILTTCSHWTDADALATYRRSALFKLTWAQTKPLFADAPLAFSHYVLRPDAPGSDVGFRVRGLEKNNPGP